MTTKDKLLRDVETIRTSINLDWQDLASLNLSLADRRNVMRHLKWCALELNILVLKLEQQETDQDA